MKIKILTSFVLLSVLSGCAGIATPTREVTEGYRIYDITGVEGHSQIVSDLKSTIQEYADKVTFTNDIPPYPLPEKPGRFQLKNPFKNSNMGALLAAQGASMKIPSCEDSIFSATSNDDFQGSENTTFFVCLLPYQAGYHMDIYYTFTKVSGGFSPEMLGKSLANSLVGDSSQFIPRTISALESAAQKSGGTLKIVQSYP